MFFVGSYSNEENTKALYKLDIIDNELKLIEALESGYNPSFLIEDEKELILLNEVGDKENLRILDKSGNCNLLSSGGVGPCHLTRFGDFLAVSNYTSGSISLLKKQDDRFKLCDVVKFEGFGPNKDRQESSHVHSSIYDEKRKVLYVVDLGCDTVTAFKIINNRLVKISQVDTQPGDGSRMMVIKDNYGFVVNELSNTVSIIKLDEADGLKIVGRYNTLPDNCKVDSFASHITIDNNKLYISNRGYDSIVVFDINKDELLEPKWIMLKGSFPRHFAIDKEKLLVANQESNSVELYSLNGDFINSYEIYKPTAIVPLSSMS